MKKIIDGYEVYCNGRIIQITSPDGIIQERTITTPAEYDVDDICIYGLGIIETDLEVYVDFKVREMYIMTNDTGISNTQETKMYHLTTAQKNGLYNYRNTCEYILGVHDKYGLILQPSDNMHNKITITSNGKYTRWTGEDLQALKTLQEEAVLHICTLESLLGKY